MKEKHAIDTAELINKYKKTMLNAGLILIALIISFRIYGAQQKKISALKEQKSAELKKNEVMESIGLTGEKLNDYKSFLNRKDISTVLKTLGNIAKESSVKIVSLRPGQERDSPEYTSYPFSLTVQADNYHLLGKFISNLENHPDVYIVEFASIRPQRQTESSSNLAMDLQIETVLYKD